MGKGPLELTIRIAGAVDSSLARSIQSAIRQTGTLEKELERSENRMAKSLNIAGTVPSQLATQLQSVANKAFVAEAALLGLGTAGLGYAVKEAISLETAMADVAKVVDGLRDENGNKTAEYETMRREIILTSMETGLSKEDVAAQVAAAGQSNIPTNELTTFAMDSAKMAVAFDVDAEQAGTWLAKWRTGFDLTQDQVRSLADWVNHLGNNTATTAAQIAAVVSDAGALGGLANMDAYTVAAISSTMMSSGGVTEDEAGTATSKIITRMMAGESATAKQKNALATLGLTSTGLAQGMVNDAAGTVLDFMQRVSQLDQTKQVSVLSNFFGNESIKGISVLVNNLSGLETSLGWIQDTQLWSDSMQKEFESRSAATDYALQKAKMSIAGFAAIVGSVFTPYINKGADWLTNFTEKLVENEDEVRRVLDGIIDKAPAIIGAFIALNTALGAMKIAPVIEQGIGSISRLVGGAKAGGAVAATAMAAGAGGTANTVANLAPVAQAAYQTRRANKLPVRGSLYEALNNPRMTAGQSYVSWLKGKDLPTAAIATGTPLAGVAQSTKAGSTVASVIGQATNTSSKGSIADLMQLDGASGKQVARAVLESAPSTIGASIQSKKDIIASTLQGGVQTLFAKADTATGGWFSQMGNHAQKMGIGQGAKQFIGDKIGAVGTWLGESKLGQGAQFIAGKASTAAQGIGAFVGKATAPVKEGALNLLSGVMGAGIDFKAGFAKPGATAGMAGKLGGGIGTIAQGAGKIFGAGGLNVMGNAGGLLGMAGTAIGPIVSGAGAIFGAVAPVIGVVSVIIALFSILRGNMEGIRGVIQNVFGDQGLAVFDGFVGTVKNVADSIVGFFSEENLGQLTQKVTDLFGADAGKIFGGLVDAFGGVKNAVADLVQFSEQKVKPILQKVFGFIGENIIPKMATAFETIGPIVGDIISSISDSVFGVMDIIAEAIDRVMPLVLGIIDVITNIAVVAGPALANGFLAVVDTVKNVVEHIRGVFDGIITFVTGVFAGNWGQAWEGVKQIFGNIVSGLVELFKAPINGVIAIVNNVISAVNKLGFTVPDWVPWIGGEHYGVNIHQIGAGNITDTTVVMGGQKMEMFAKGGFTNGPSIAGEAGVEAVISFDPSVRSQNIANWWKAGQMLGAIKSGQTKTELRTFDEKQGNQSKSNTVSQNDTGIKSAGGITFAPQIIVQGNASLVDIRKALRDSYEEFKALMARYEREKSRKQF